MKKMVFTLLLAKMFFFSNVYAQQSMICPFTDYFTIYAPVGYEITSLSGDGNVLTNKETPTQFSVFCKDYTSAQNGNAYVTVAHDFANLCTLHIVDGPFEMNPYVNFINCVGRIRYLGMDHVWGTYKYKLKFAHF